MLQEVRTMFYLSHRVLALALFAVLTGTASMLGATLEKLSLDDMSRKSTTIVRGRVTSCQGEQQGPAILTRCRVQVTENWKGTLPEATFFIPGGQANGLVQNIAGAPKVTEGQEYVLFLWTGRSGKAQLIGLSQGLFDLSVDGKGGEARVRRAASTEVMLDKTGKPVTDSAVDLSVSELRSRVQRALTGEVRQ
jgi:hypothetical protein